jgi:hypothetical protein
MQLAAGHATATVTKYFTNLGTKTITVILETAIAENGQYKVDKTVEKDLLPGARNVAVAISGKELYQINFTMVSKQHPDKTFKKGDRINRSKYFMVDDDMMVEMQNDPFN